MHVKFEGTSFSHCYSNHSISVRTNKRINKHALVLAAHFDDKAAEANEELNSYNATITKLVQRFFEEDKVSQFAYSLVIF